MNAFSNWDIAHHVVNSKILRSWGMVNNALFWRNNFINEFKNNVFQVEKTPEKKLIKMALIIIAANFEYKLPSTCFRLSTFVFCCLYRKMNEFFDFASFFTCAIWTDRRRKWRHANNLYRFVAATARIHFAYKECAAKPNRRLILIEAQAQARPFSVSVANGTNSLNCAHKSFYFHIYVNYAHFFACK